MSVWWCCCTDTTTSFTAGATDDGCWEPGGAFAIFPYCVFGDYDPPPVEVSSQILSGLVRFTNVTIPNAATIVSAKLSIINAFLDTATGTGGSASCNISGEDADNATTITSASQADSAVRTTASVSYSQTTDQYAAGDDFETPSLVAIVQEIVNRAGWASGNSMQFFFDEAGTSSANTIAHFVGSVLGSFPDNPPRLQVTYS